MLSAGLTPKTANGPECRNEESLSLFLTPQPPSVAYFSPFHLAYFSIFIDIRPESRTLLTLVKVQTIQESRKAVMADESGKTGYRPLVSVEVRGEWKER